MPRRALLIGSQSQGLSGVDTDVDTMDDLLTRRGFTVARCQGPRACRAGIIDAYERLVRDTRPGDAAVVFYSGPGGTAHSPPGSAHEQLAPVPMIVPTDYDESTESSFHGITALELSMLHARLAAATGNATVILDTCHTAHLSRDEDLRVKALYRPAYLDLDDHVARLRRRRIAPGTRYGLPSTVHAAACAPEQSAYEYTDPAGRRAGLFTASLATALAEAGDQPVNWTTIIERIRRRVLSVAPNQRPRIAGPARRVPFDTADGPAGAWAHRARVGPSALPVRLAGPADHLAGVAAAVSASPMVRRAEPDDDMVVEVRADPAGRLTVHDRVGVLHPPRRGDAAGLALVMSHLTHLSRAAALRGLAAGRRAAFGAPVTVEWGTVADGRTRPLPAYDAVVHVGEHLYVRVRNDGAETVHVSLIDIGVSSRTTLVTALDPAGVALRPGEEYLVGRDASDGRLAGVPLVWPLEIVGTDPRPETILVLVSSSPQDVGALSLDGVPDPASGARSVPYDVHTIGFQLNPAQPPAPDAPGFVLDERPEPSVRLAGRRGTAGRRRVVVRFDDLLVTRVPAPGVADLRLDVLALAGDGTSRPRYRARTARFGKIRAGDRLGLVEPPAYLGDAVDFLDLAVWVSWSDPAEKAGPALGDMLALVSRAEPSRSLRRAVDGAIGSSPGQVATAAIGAADRVVNVAHGLLSRAAPGSVGLYRISLLAHEDFGVGRHPARGRLRADGFSLSYAIEDVGCGHRSGIDRPADGAGLRGSIH